MIAPTIASVSSALEPIIPIRSKKRRPIGKDVIPVGILHSLSGTMAISEKSLVDGELLAIDEINRSGGVLGREIVPRIEDGASNWDTFRAKIELLVQAQMVTVFGGWTSASRKVMLPVLEATGHLLWYPLMYEGQECSQNIFYMGMVPNQILSVVNWLSKTYPKRPFYLVASDYVFPRVVNTILKTVLERQRIPILDEAYIPLGDTETPGQVVEQIRRKAPAGAVIFNMINGDSNVSFYYARVRQRMNDARYPVITTSISEEEVAAISVDYMQDTLTIASYFQTVNNPVSRQLVASVKQAYGEDRVVTEAIAAAYTAVYLWKLAVEKARTATDLNQVEKAARGLIWDAPMGRIQIQQNHHLSLPVRVGKVRSDGLFDIVFESAAAIMPEPWNQDLPDTKGYACDWSDPQRGEKYRHGS
jgi:urea transport system substrate-binding protein